MSLPGFRAYLSKLVANFNLIMMSKPKYIVILKTDILVDWVP